MTGEDDAVIAQLHRKKVIGNATLYCGDAVEVLKTLPAKSVQMCVTSPPYWGLRDYGHAGQLGLEPTPDAYVAGMVEVFRCVRDLLADDGTLWLNLGDSYAHSMRQSGVDHAGKKQNTNEGSVRSGFKPRPQGLKEKDLIGIPWRVAFALQADGWYLRQDIIWHKPNPMPESVTDRCTKAHEYIFLLSKSARYYFDSAAIAEPSFYPDDKRRPLGSKGAWQIDGREQRENGGGVAYDHDTTTRNKRSVWTVTTKPFKEAHFATFPPKLIEPCILAGSRSGDVVLDPFNGSGTSGIVAVEHGRHYVGIEINPAYLELTIPRIENAQRQERMFL